MYRGSGQRAENIDNIGIQFPLCQRRKLQIWRGRKLEDLLWCSTGIGGISEFMVGERERKKEGNEKKKKEGNRCRCMLCCVCVYS